MLSITPRCSQEWPGTITYVRAACAGWNNSLTSPPSSGPWSAEERLASGGTEALPVQDRGMLPSSFRLSCSDANPDLAAFAMPLQSTTILSPGIIQQPLYDSNTAKVQFTMEAEQSPVSGWP